MHLLRGVSALLGLGTLLFIYGSGRLLWPGDPYRALLALSLVAFLPQFNFLHASVTNDTLIIFLVSAALWQIIRLWLDRVTRGRLFLLGVTGCVFEKDLFMEFDNTASSLEANLEFRSVEWFEDVIVGTCFHAFNQIVVAIVLGDKDQISVVFRTAIADMSAHFKAGHSGHGPVQQTQRRGTLALKNLPCLPAICNDNDLVPPLGQFVLQGIPGDRIIVCYEYSHCHLFPAAFCPPH